MKKNLLLISLISLIGCSLNAQIINVPIDQPTIQAGINAATNGDTVLVDNGTYYENIRFMGKAITVASNFILDADTNHINNTIIDGSQPQHPDSAAAVMFVGDEDTTSVLYGFTITGGLGLIVQEFDMRLGGGIACESAGAKILNNKINNNEINFSGYAGGGGIGCVSEDEDNWLVARNNLISGNNCSSDGIEAFGGGVFSGTNLIIENNEIYENTCTGTNTAEANGGAVLLGSQSNTLIFNIYNNYIHDNHCDGNTVAGAGVLLWYSEGVISGNEFWNNSGDAETSSQGGGLCLNGVTGITNIIGNDFNTNTLVGQQVQGGGLQVSLSDYPVNIENNSFGQNILTASNVATGGGLIIIENGNDIMVNNNQIEGNTLEGGEFISGAGLAIANPFANIALDNNLFSANNGTGPGDGGGIYLFNANELLIEINGNIFENNSMNGGGGLSTFNSYNVKLTNNIFSSNYADEFGGGCKFKHYGSNFKNQEVVLNKDLHPLIINNTFFSNTSSTGGAIYSDHQQEFLIIANSIFWENNSQTGKDIYQSGNESFQVHHNDVDTNLIVGNWNGFGNIYDNPLFIDPLNGDYHIDNCESLCVNAGIEALEINGNLYYCPGIDMDNDTRPFENTMPDIGADETPCFETSIKDNSDIIASNSLNCYPNPFYSKTQIDVSIQIPDFVMLSVIDFTGNIIQTIVSENLQNGNHTFELNAEGLPAGIYFLKMEANGISETRKLIIVK